MTTTFYPLLVSLVHNTIEPISTQPTTQLPVPKDELLATIIWANQQVDISDPHIRTHDFYTWNILSLYQLSNICWSQLSIQKYDKQYLNYDPKVHNLAHTLSSSILALLTPDILPNTIITCIHNSIELVVRILLDSTEKMTDEQQYFIASSNFMLTQKDDICTLYNVMYVFDTPFMYCNTMLPFIYRIYYASAILDLERYHRNKGFLLHVVENIRHYIDSLEVE